ncbi:type II secretion system F family protein [Spirillospora sp. NPDC047279]|uniref:type II secretion system F family protein n=1 Tax=Spirillospora sp. NPDC047279 TaxID=3155478 RepID=UPI0033C2B27F
MLAGLGLPTASIRRDLAVLDRPPERLLAEKASCALTGLLLGPITIFLFGLAGFVFPWQAPAWTALAMGAVGFFVPDLAVRAQAAARRAEFRHSLSAFLDLVVISLAGGAGVEAALSYGAAAGQGWPFDQIRRALDNAQLTRQPPWHSLSELGHTLDIPELVELAGSVSLAGTEGAKIRASLTAKAAGLRARQLTDAEAQAQAATERLSLPVVLLFAGFLVLLGFPAVANILIDF